MTLKEWKEKNRYTYRHLEAMSGIPEARLKQICTGYGCVRLDNAARIVDMTKGEVDFCDLLTGGCG